MEREAKAAAVFLDRDGTLVREVGHLRRLEDLEVLPRVPAALRLLRGCGLKLVVVTNQSAVARGYLTEEELAIIHDELLHRLAADGAMLDKLYYCPHHPTEGLPNYAVLCECRKPKAGLIRRAAEELSLDPRRSYLVGDQRTDMELAAGVGAMGIWLREEEADARIGGATVRVAKNLWEAAQWVVSHYGQAK